MIFHREAEDDPFLRPTQLRDEGNQNISGGTQIKPMYDLLYCRNIYDLCHIILCLGRVLEGTPVQRQPDLQSIHNTFNLIHLNF